MAIRPKLKYILSSKGKFVVDYADYAGYTRQGMNQKFRGNAFNISELIRLGEWLGYHLAFVNEKGEVVIAFNSDDLEDTKPRKLANREPHKTKNMRARKSVKVLEYDNPVVFKTDDKSPTSVKKVVKKKDAKEKG